MSPPWKHSGPRWMGLWATWSIRRCLPIAGGLEPGDPNGPFQTKPFYDSVILRLKKPAGLQPCLSFSAVWRTYKTGSLKGTSKHYWWDSDLQKQDNFTCCCRIFIAKLRYRERGHWNGIKYSHKNTNQDFFHLAHGVFSQFFLQPVWQTAYQCRTNAVRANCVFCSIEQSKTLLWESLPQGCVSNRL